MGNESIAFLKTEQNRLYCYAQNQSEAIKKRSLRVFSVAGENYKINMLNNYKIRMYKTQV